MFLSVIPHSFIRWVISMPDVAGIAATLTYAIRSRTAGSYSRSVDPMYLAGMPLSARASSNFSPSIFLLVSIAMSP